MFANLVKHKFRTALSGRYYNNLAPRNFLCNLRDRSLVADIFPKEQGREFAAYLTDSPRSLYAGFDPTGDSLHLGNLLVVIALLHAQRSGHYPIAIIGGATAQIGDPSGRSEERTVLDSQTIKQNIQSIGNSLSVIFDHHQRHLWEADKTRRQSKLNPLRVVDNLEWYQRVNFVDFLSKIGRHIRVGRMLSRQSVKSRLTDPFKDGINFAEFSYQLFQAYDWLYLYRQFECKIQLGGSDQMGNIHCGHELISRVESDSVFGLVLPLLTTDNGRKLGKSIDSNSTIWLNPAKTSAFKFYQHFVRIPDSQIESMLLRFSFLHINEITQLMNCHMAEPSKRIPHHRLAQQMTLLVHGAKGLSLAEKTTEILFPTDQNADRDQVASKLSCLSFDEMRIIFDQAVYVRMLYSPGISLLDFVLKIGCFSWDRDAIRIIKAGGLYINQVKRQNIDEIILPNFHILSNSLTLVRVGKKHYYIVEWTF